MFSRSFIAIIVLICLFPVAPSVAQLQPEYVWRQIGLGPAPLSNAQESVDLRPELGVVILRNATLWQVWNLNNKRLQTTGDGPSGFTPTHGPVFLRQELTTANDEIVGQLSGQVVASIPRPANTQSPWFSPKGNWLVYPRNDRLTLVRTSDGSVAGTIPTPSDGIPAFSSDEGTIAVGLGSHSALPEPRFRLFNLETGAEISTMVDSVYRPLLAFTPDGNQVVAVGTIEGQLLSVFDAASGQKLAEVPLGNVVPTRIEVTANGRHAVVETTSAVLVVDLVAKQLQRTFTGSAPRSFALSPNGAMLATGVQGQIQLWDLPTDTLLRTVRTQGTQITALDFSPDGAQLAGVATATSFIDIILHDVATNVTVSGFYGDVLRLLPKTFSRDGSLLAVASSDRYLIRRASDGANVATLPGAIGEAAFSPDGRLLAVVTGQVTDVWDIQTARRLWRGSGTWPNPIAFTSETTIATLSSGTVLFRNALTGADERRLASDQPISNFGVTPDGSTLYVATPEETRYYSLPLLQLQRTAPVRSWSEASANGSIFAVTERGQGTFIVSATTGFLLHIPPPTPFESGYSMAISPDGKTIATATGGTLLTIRVLNTRNRQEVAVYVLSGDRSHWPNTDIVFSPDSRNLAIPDIRNSVALIRNPNYTSAADTDESGCVDDADLTNMILDFGGPPRNGYTDATNDGVVDDADLTVLILSFGEGC